LTLKSNLLFTSVSTADIRGSRSEKGAETKGNKKRGFAGKQERVMGFEPTTTTLATLCSTN